MGLKMNTHGEETEDNQTPELSAKKIKALKSTTQHSGEVISADRTQRGTVLSVDVEGIGIVPVLYVGKEFAHDMLESGQEIRFGGSVEYHRGQKVFRTDSIHLTDTGEIPTKSDIIQFFVDVVGVDPECEATGDDKHNYGLKQFGMWRIVKDAYADRFEKWRKKNGR